jgi:hypothetical protein
MCLSGSSSRALLALAASARCNRAVVGKCDGMVVIDIMMNVGFSAGAAMSAFDDLLPTATDFVEIVSEHCPVEVIIRLFIHMFSSSHLDLGKCDHTNRRA